MIGWRASAMRQRKRPVWEYLSEDFLPLFKLVGEQSPWGLFSSFIVRMVRPGPGERLTQSAQSVPVQLGKQPGSAGADRQGPQMARILGLQGTNQRSQQGKNACYLVVRVVRMAERFRAGTGATHESQSLLRIAGQGVKYSV